MSQQLLRIDTSCGLTPLLPVALPFIEKVLFQCSQPLTCRANEGTAVGASPS